MLFRSVLLNVSGQTTGFTFAGMSLSGIGAENVLFNFYEADEVVVFNGVGVLGSVLAPFANIDAVNGNIGGNVVGRSLHQSQEYQTTIEFHNSYFNGDLPTVAAQVPVPASIFIFAPALLGFWGLKRKILG